MSRPKHRLHGPAITTAAVDHVFQELLNAKIDELQAQCRARPCPICAAIPEPRLALPGDWMQTGEMTIAFRYRCGHVTT